MNSIASLINEIVSPDKSTQNVFFGVVQSVNLDNRTCSVNPTNSTAVISEIRLIAQSDSNDEEREGMTLIPQVGSMVMVVMESDVEGFIGMFSQVQTMEWKVTGQEGDSTTNWTAEQNQQRIKNSEGTASTTVITSVDGISKEIQGTTGSTSVDITADGYSQTTGMTTVEFQDQVVIKNGASLKGILEDMLMALSTLTVPTGVGPSGTPIQAPTFQPDITTKINQLFKE